tara:strand:- start:9550 stop:11508 length:1959 start_codon:yes stop_codon:yes gene_type:complete
MADKQSSSSDWLVPAVCVLVFGVLGSAIYFQRNPAKPPLNPPAPIGATKTSDSNPHSSRPQQEAFDGYVSSANCRECHEYQHDTWHASYHRTMTQVASTNSVLGSFDGVTYTLPRKNETIHLSRDGNEFFARLPRYESLQYDPPKDSRGYPIVMTTGSHHTQAYWFSLNRQTDRSVALLPMMYIKADKRWVPRESVFLHPPEFTTSAEIGRWNKTCLNCHSTHPDTTPHMDQQSIRFETRVAEFGIACEACHGPAKEHIALHRAAKQNGQAVGNDPIINPSELHHTRSGEVCGQCHSVHTTRPRENMIPPDIQKIFRPGDDLDETRMVVMARGERRAFVEKVLLDGGVEVPTYFRDRFWDDGTIRLAGREYNGLIESACHTQGEMDCLSCHQLHKARKDERTLKQWADDQLSLTGMGEQACLQCHEQDQFQTPKHTHHPPGSSGAGCYNCHMPHTTYGLLKGIRSHTIESPRVEQSLRHKKPNACNLCHLDQTLEWTAKHLHEWYGHEIPELSDDHQTVSEAVRGLIQDDAGVRSIIAWHLGWKPAQEASGTAWIAPHLALLMQDPYDAIRYIAARSLKRLPGFERSSYDFIANAGERESAILDSLSVWQSTVRTNIRNHANVLLDAEGNRNIEKLSQLLSTRNNRPISLQE